MKAPKKADKGEEDPDDAVSTLFPLSFQLLCAIWADLFKRCFPFAFPGFQGELGLSLPSDGGGTITRDLVWHHVRGVLPQGIKDEKRRKAKSHFFVFSFSL